MLRSLFLPARTADPIARVVARPGILAGRRGELADQDLVQARRDDIEWLTVMMLEPHLGSLVAIEIDWQRRPAPAIEAVTLAGNRVPDGDARLPALRAAAAEAIMIICDGGNVQAG
jgi:hypothetical protein